MWQIYQLKTTKFISEKKNTKKKKTINFFWVLGNSILTSQKYRIVW